MDILCSLSIGQLSHISCGDYFRIRIGPSDSGNRSTSGDTGEGELRIGFIGSRVHAKDILPDILISPKKGTLENVYKYKLIPTSHLHCCRVQHRECVLSLCHPLPHSDISPQMEDQ